MSDSAHPVLLDVFCLKAGEVKSRVTAGIVLKQPKKYKNKSMLKNNKRKQMKIGMVEYIIGG